MATYKEGQRYLRNNVTGAVFQYRDRIAGLADMVEMQADAEGNLTKVEPRAKEEVTRKLNPTKTPEKPRTAPPQKPTQHKAPPTLTPTDK